MKRRHSLMMNRKVICSAALFLIVGSVILFWKGLTEQAASEESASFSPRTRHRERPDPLPVMERLRRLTETPVSRAPKFETVERWVSKLSVAEIRELIEELWATEYTGLTGWLRCALYAEWGRRDPLGAIEYLKSHGSGLTSFRNYPQSQALYSIFRGWASVNPEGALEEWEMILRFQLASSEIPTREQIAALDDSKRLAARIVREIYKQLARQDPDKAIELAKIGDRSRLRNVGIMEGILSGISSNDVLRRVIDDWMDDVWMQNDTKVKIEAYKKSATSLATGFISIPDEERILGHGALAMAEGNLTEAYRWILAQNGEGHTLGRENKLLISWAERHPDEAIQVIRSGDYESRSTQIAIGAMRSNPEIGPVIMAALAPMDRDDVFSQYITTMGSHHEDDFFPAPGQLNRLRDFKADYQTIIETILAAQLPKNLESRFIEQARQEFAGHLMGDLQTPPDE